MRTFVQYFIKELKKQKLTKDFASSKAPSPIADIVRRTQERATCTHFPISFRHEEGEHWRPFKSRMRLLR